MSPRFLRRLGVVVAAAGVVALPLVPATGQPAAPDAERGAAVVRAPASPRVDDTYRKTQHLSRVWVDAQGNENPVASYDMTVQASGLTELRGRERVEISWKGAPPSGGRSANPYGPPGMSQEYPVMVLQCRGVDDPDAPPDEQLSPETCWTNSVAERSVITAGGSNAPWTVDHYATPEEKALVSGADPFPSDQCPDEELPDIGLATHITPFVAANGKVYPFCNPDTVAPEAAVDSALPAAEVAAFSDLNGNGSVQFEVRSSTENESLGCNDKVACSIVVVPIVGLSCDYVPPDAPQRELDASKACRKYGEFAPGASNFAGLGVDRAVSPELWWSPSNWRNRFSIPIDFGLPPDACDVLDPRPPTGFFGSELMAQAALQWAPAYCLNKDRFKFQLNQMPENTAWSKVDIDANDPIAVLDAVPAGFVSEPHEQVQDDPIGYAPTAVTGFSIGYVIDKPDNAGEYTDLTLNPRLIAKLLTQSYLGSDLGRGHPGIGGNPLGIMNDPEFQQLNPGLSQISQEAGATVMSLADSADLMLALTQYIAQDKDAMDFIHGKPDPWGMVVNPSYKDIDLPRDDWPLLDEYIPETDQECRQNNPSVYFNQIAAPTTALRKIADALIDAWPLVATKCEKDASTNTYKIGRIDRQGYGARFLMGLVSTGDAERFGLHQAALETTPGKYVGPTQEGMTAAVRVARQQEKYGPFTMDQAKLVRSGDAYPGTMIVSTVARMQNLDQDWADQVASFIRVATTEGQRPGRGNGELPAGYLPIRRTGATAPLWRAAQETADAIEAQKAPPEPGDDDPDQSDGPGSGAAPGATGTTEPTTPEASEPPGADDPTDGPVDAAVAPTSATRGESSGWGSSLLPALLIVGLLAGASSIVSRLVGSRTGG